MFSPSSFRFFFVYNDATADIVMLKEATLTLGHAEWKPHT